jgi:hypothetical protein
MDSSPGDCEANEHDQKIKGWRKIYYPQSVRKHCSYLQSNALSEKGSMEILFGKSIQIHMGKHLWRQVYF